MTRYLLSVLFAVLVTGIVSAADFTTTVNNATPNVNDTIAVTVNANVPVGEAFTTAQQFLAFDNTKLELTAQAAGTGGIFVPDPSALAVINAAGQIHAGAFSFTAISGTMTLGVFSFKALAPGVTNVTSAPYVPVTAPFGNLLVKADATQIVPSTPAPLPITIGGGANNPPVITEGASVNVTMSEDGTPTAFSLTLNATDADGNTITWAISGAASHGTATASGTGASKAIGYTPVANYNGADSFVVQVSDGNGGTDTCTVNVTIQPVNDAPTITSAAWADPNPVTLPAGTTVHVVAGDVDGDTLGYAWTKQSGPGTVTFATANAADSGVTFSAAGTYGLRVTVSDGNGGSVTSDVTVTVNAAGNNPPVITEGASVNVTMSEDGTPTAFSLTLNATDADGNTITWSISGAASHGTATASGTGASKAIGYTPVANYNGADSFVVQVSDGNGGTDTCTVNVTVQPVNDAPVAVNDSYSTNQDTALTVTAPGVLTNDTDVEGSALTAAKVSDPTHGTVTLNANGSFTYTPAAGYSGSDSFTYQANDGAANSNTATVSIAVNAAGNTPPVITEGASVNVTMSEDGVPTAFSLTLNATDANGDTITWSVSGAASHGTATASGTGASKAIGYTPNANYNGADSFVVQVDDGNGGTDACTVNVTIQPVNDVPVITEGASVNVTMSEDGVPTAFSLTLNATDADGDTITWSVTTAASHGTATASGTGASKAIGYTPVANYVGTDSFVVRVADGHGGTASCTVNVTIQPANDVPVITEGASVNVTMSEDGTPTAFSLTLHATDADGDTITWSVATAASHGTATVSGTGAVKAIAYTPVANYNGADSFVVQVADGNGGTASCTVNVTIQPVNDAPVAVNDSYGTALDTALTVPAPGVLTNDTDVDSDPLTAIRVSSPAHGTVTLNADGSFTYTPAAGYSGNDSFTYYARDGVANSNTATVSIAVGGANTPPVLAGIEGTALAYTENDPATAISATVTASDADNANLVGATIQLTGNYQNGQDLLGYVQVGSIGGTWTAATGTLSLSGSDTVANYQAALRAVTYQNTSENPSPLARTVSFTVNDGAVNSNTVTRNINVTAANDAPVAVDDLYSTLHDVALTVPAAGVLANDTDAEGNPLTAAKVTDPAHGTVTLNANGSFTYTPAAAYSGSDSFAYRANDGTANSNVATVTINVTSDANVAPVAADQAVTCRKNRSVAITLTATDANGDVLSYDVVSDPVHGTLSGVAPDLTYTPMIGYAGTDTFTFVANDGALDSNEATVTITVKKKRHTVYYSSGGGGCALGAGTEPATAGWWLALAAALAGFGLRRWRRPATVRR